MTKAIFDRVLNLDSAELDPIVQAALNDDSATATGSLSSQSVGAPSIGAGTLAITKIAGDANTSNGSRAWSAVIKAIDTLETTRVGGDAIREITAFETGLLNFGGRGMRAVRCYRVEQLPENHVWLWLEDLSEWIGSPWSVDEYLRASKQIGLFTGYWSAQELPDGLLLNIDRTLARYSWQDIGWSMMGVGENESPDPLLRQGLPGHYYSVAQKLGMAADSARAILANGERVFSHGDCHPRNMFLPPENGLTDRMVAVDWPHVGSDLLGADFGSLIGSGLSWHDDEFKILFESESKCFEAFSEGLFEGGWSGDQATARMHFLFGVCGYGMMFAAAAVNIGENLQHRDWFIGRSGAASPEEAFEAYASRAAQLGDMAEELESLAAQLK